MPDDIEIEISIPETETVEEAPPVVVVAEADSAAQEIAFIAGTHETEIEQLHAEIESLTVAQSEQAAATIAVSEAVITAVETAAVANATAEVANETAAVAIAEANEPEPVEDKAPGKAHWLHRSWRDWVGAN